MTDAPAWLQGSNREHLTGGDTLAPSAPAPVNAGNSTTSSTINSSNAGDGSLEPDLPGVILTMRLANMGVAVAFIAISVRFFELSRFRYGVILRSLLFLTQSILPSLYR